MISLLFASILTGFHPHTNCLCFAYINRDGSQEVYVSEHLFQSLVHDKWCIKVFLRREDITIVKICQM